MYGYIYIDKTIYHLSLRVARLNPMCYLAGVLISKSKCCLWIPRGCSQGGWGRMEGEGSDSDVPPSISQSCCDGDNAKSTDGISAAPQIGSKHAASHLHHPSSQMKYKGENGQWVMEIDSKETWVVINMVPSAAKQHKTPRTTHCLLQAKVGCHHAACVQFMMKVSLSEWYATAEGAQLIRKIRALCPHKGKKKLLVQFCFVRVMMDWSKASHKQLELSDAFKVALNDKTFLGPLLQKKSFHANLHKTAAFILKGIVLGYTLICSPAKN